MTEKNLENVFKEALGNYEADVNPTLWQSVQSGLVSKGAAVTGTSGAAQAGSIAGSLGVKGMLWIASAVIISGAGLYFATTGTEEKQVQPAPVKQEAPAVSANTPAIQDRTLAEIETESKQTQNIQAENGLTVPPAAVVKENKTQPAQVTPAVSHPTSSPSAGKPVPDIVENKNSNSREESRPATTTEINSAPAENKLQPVTPDAAAFEQIENYLLPDKSGLAKLPNIFAPDGDGLNDEFTLQTKGLQSLEVTIFNNSGKVIYKWSDLHGRWNGLLSNGQPAEPGMYKYSVQAVTTENKICIAMSSLMLKR